ncbi:hypothetical protein [Aerosakkonema funiforme]|uniref:hypothetical protein n=1 Tax=Aerosakkonema funiforme TaxID=1246630 RepID=UPI0035BBE424
MSRLGEQTRCFFAGARNRVSSSIVHGETYHFSYKPGFFVWQVRGSDRRTQPNINEASSNKLLYKQRHSPWLPYVHRSKE